MIWMAIVKNDEQTIQVVSGACCDGDGGTDLDSTFDHVGDQRPH